MITKYFTEVAVKFSPSAGKSAKIARAFLASIPAHSRANMKISNSILEVGSPVTPEINVKFKDGKNIKLDLTTVQSTGDMEQLFDRYSRSLQIKQDISD